MKKTIFEKRIPTLLGIVMIIIGIAATTFFVRRGVNIIGRAAPQTTPVNIRIVNISDTSFTVSYITGNDVLGTINFGKTENLGNIIGDDADSGKTGIPHTVHISTIKNLTPATTYLFTITSGETTFFNDGKPFNVTTAPAIQRAPAFQSFQMNGILLFEENQNSDCLIYVAAAGSQTFATRVKPDGTYTIDLSSMRSQDLASYLDVADNTLVKMLIVGLSKQSNITLFAKQIHPVPTIIFSKDYDFTLGTTPVASSAASIGFPSLSASPEASKNPQIITPKKNEGFTDLQPLFKGVASPSSEIQIEIHSSEQIKTKVTADKNGSWTFRPETPLSPGLHTISITTRDSYGILKTIGQSFTVYAQGTQVTQTATPSATVTPSKSPSITPTIAITPTPTLFLTPTPKIISIPTTVPGTDIPSPGNTSFLLLGVAALAATTIGTLFFILTHGATL